MISIILKSELNWLKEMSQIMNSVAEIGCWKGNTTKIFLENCKGPVYAVDHFKGSWSDLTKLFSRNLFNKFIKNVGSYSNLNVIRIPSPQATKEVPSIDMVFIDAKHTYEAVKEDILAWKPKTRILICGHDYGSWPGVTKAVNELLPNASVFKTIWFKWIEEIGID